MYVTSTQPCVADRAIIQQQGLRIWQIAARHTVGNRKTQTRIEIRKFFSFIQAEEYYVKQQHTDMHVQ